MNEEQKESHKKTGITKKHGRIIHKRKTKRTKRNNYIHTEGEKNDKNNFLFFENFKRRTTKKYLCFLRKFGNKRKIY